MVWVITMCVITVYVIIICVTREVEREGVVTDGRGQVNVNLRAGGGQGPTRNRFKGLANTHIHKPFHIHTYAYIHT